MLIARFSQRVRTDFEIHEHDRCRSRHTETN